jgi:hypothetical protein
MSLKSLFARRSRRPGDLLPRLMPEAPPATPPVLCPKPEGTVLYCAWRSGKCCNDGDHRFICTGVWEKGLGR